MSDLMEFQGVEVKLRQYTEEKRKATPYERLWKMLMKHLKSGYEVFYEEYVTGDGKTYCRGHVKK